VQIFAKHLFAKKATGSGESHHQHASSELEMRITCNQ
jgi:hypothetical protein